MRIIFSLVFCSVFIVLIHAKPQEKYTTKYDNIDLDAIIRSDRLLRNYLDCVLGKRSCTRDGEELKRHIPDALTTHCSKCSDVQKNGTKKIIKYLIKERPSWFEELERKYDPSGAFRRDYADEIRREGIAL